MCLYLKGIYDAIIEPHIPSVCYFLLYLISLDGFLLLSCHKGNVHSLLLFSHAATTHTHTHCIYHIFLSNKLMILSFLALNMNMKEYMNMALYLRAIIRKIYNNNKKHTSLCWYLKYNSDNILLFLSSIIQHTAGQILNYFLEMED